MDPRWDADPTLAAVPRWLHLVVTLAGLAFCILCWCGVIAVLVLISGLWQP